MITVILTSSYVLLLLDPSPPPPSPILFLHYSSHLFLLKHLGMGTKLSQGPYYIQPRCLGLGKARIRDSVLYYSHPLPLTKESVPSKSWPQFPHL